MTRFILTLTFIGVVVGVAGHFFWGVVHGGLSGGASAATDARLGDSTIPLGFGGDARPNAPVPENLSRLLEEKDRRRLQVKLDVLLPAAQALVDAADDYRIQSEVYYMELEWQSNRAGEWAAIGVNMTPPAPPQWAQLEMRIRQCKLSYQRSRETYSSRLAEIDQWFFERTRGMRKGRAAKAEPQSLLEPKHAHDPIILGAENIVAGH